MKQRLLKLTAITTIITTLTACGTMTGIPAHGGGKRFATEQRLVSASVRSALKDIDVSPLRGKRVAVVFDIVADEGGGTMSGGRMNIIGGLTAGYLASPLTSASSAFQLFNLNDSGTNYSNNSNGGNNTASTTFVSNGTSNNTSNFNQTNNSAFNQTNQGSSNGTNNNISSGTFAQNSSGNNTSNSTTNGSSTGTTSENMTGTINSVSNGTSGSNFNQTAQNTGSSTGSSNGTNSNTSNGAFAQSNSGSSSGSNTGASSGSNTGSGSNASTGSNNQNGAYTSTGNQIGGYTANRQAISNEASNRITQTKGVESKRGVSLDYKGLGEYQNLSVPKSDASLLMGLVRNYLLLNHVTPTTPSDSSADAILYVTVDVFGIIRSRFDAYAYNQETLKAETSFEMMAFDRSGQILLTPRTANREAQYAERYLLWAGPFRTDEKVRKGKGLLVDFADVDGEHKTYGSEKVEASYPFGKN
ncbi:MAG: hypothetical protein ACRCV6_10350 [Formosimonas sp.]